MELFEALEVILPEREVDATIIEMVVFQLIK